MFRALLLLAVLFATAGAPAQPGARKPAGCRIRHIGIACDLDSARLAREFDKKIREANEARVDTIVIELLSDHARTDVVHQMAGSIRAATVRTTVWLRRGKDGSVGIGQAVLGLVATECWIEPGTRIEGRGGDQADRLELAPKGTNHDKLAEELMRWSGERRVARGFDPLLPRLLLGSPASMWAVADTADATLRISPIEPLSGPEAPARAIPLMLLRLGSPTELSLSSELAVELRLAAGSAEYLINLFERRGLRPDVSIPLPVEVDLDRIIANASASLEALDRELEAIETELRAKPRDQRINTEGFYRELGARVLKRTPKALEALDACEQLLVADPEIARTPPPGASRVGAPDTQATAWRRAFQKRRDLIARLEKKARGFTGR